MTNPEFYTEPPEVFTVPLILTTIFFPFIGVPWLIIRVWERNSVIRKNNRMQKYFHEEWKELTQ